MLVELAQERDEDIPALVYEARSTRRGQTGATQAQAETQPRHSSRAGLPPATATHHIEGNAASASADRPSEAHIAADQGKVKPCVSSMTHRQRGSIRH